VAYQLTAANLKADVLGLAGEPGDGTSQYDGQVYEYLTTVQRSLVSGGPFGASSLQPLDWPWVRAYPRGTLVLPTPFNANGAVNLQLVSNSDIASFVNVPEIDGQVATVGDVPGRFIHWRLILSGTTLQMLIVSRIGLSQLRLQQPWPLASVITSAWVATPDTYVLPADFVRGCGPLIVQGWPYAIPVVDAPQLESLYPTATWAAGPPVMAARVDQQRLKFSHYPSLTADPLLLEFEYVKRPPVIAEGEPILVPQEHRRVLVYGAAYLIAQEKGDDDAEWLLTHFQTQWKAMRDETVRSYAKMAPGFWGVPQPSIAATTSIGPAMRTSTGLAAYWW
jgi:hypothetical protein